MKFKRVLRRCGQLTSGCGLWLRPSAFYTNDAYGHEGLSRRCKACLRLAARLSKYKLTRQAYKAMLADQGGCCARCLDPLQDGGCLDHDWSCCPSKSRTCGRCLRGLLCRGCNCLLTVAWVAANPQDDYIARYRAERHKRGRQHED